MASPLLPRSVFTDKRLQERKGRTWKQRPRRRSVKKAGGRSKLRGSAAASKVSEAAGNVTDSGTMHDWREADLWRV